MAKQEVSTVSVAEERIKRLAKEIMEKLAKEKAFELGIKKPIFMKGRTETRYSRLTSMVEELIAKELGQS